MSLNFSIFGQGIVDTSYSNWPNEEIMIKAIGVDGMPYDLNKNLEHTINASHSNLKKLDLSKMVVSLNASYSNFEDADFSYTYFGWADITGSYVEGLNLRSARGKIDLEHTLGSPRLRGCYFHTIKADRYFKSRLSKKDKKYLEKYYILDDNLAKMGIFVWKHITLTI